MYDMSGRFVKVYTDNQNSVLIACKGSTCMNNELHQLALHMFGLCVAHSIELEIEWIPRNMNTVADELTKVRCMTMMIGEFQIKFLNALIRVG